MDVGDRNRLEQVFEDTELTENFIPLCALMELLHDRVVESLVVILAVDFAGLPHYLAYY